MTTTPIRPRFSIVSAVRDGETELPAFIASVEAQRFDLGRAEVIVVDDGSTDGSAARLADWAARRPDLVRLVTTERAGHAAARNRGLAEATGEWVTFVDGDGRLEPDFLAVADRFATARPDVEVMAGRIIGPADTRRGDGHTHGRAAGRAAAVPPQPHDQGHDQPVDLRKMPDRFPGPAGHLLKVSRARDVPLDPRIAADFADAHRVARCLLDLPAPLVGYLDDARYLDPRGIATDRALRRRVLHHGSYVDLLRYGYLDLIERARRTTGSVPAWLQHLLVFEISWFLSEEDKLSTSITVPDDEIPAFHELLGRIVCELDPSVVRAHRARRLQARWVDILAHGYRPDRWHSEVALRAKVDAAMGLQRIHYRYIGPAPAESFVVGGAPTDVAFGKVRSHRYFGRSLMEERIAWLPTGGLEVRLDGETVAIADRWPDPSAGAQDAASPQEESRRRSVWPARRARLTRRLRSAPGRLVARGVRAIAHGPVVARSFRDAWVLMDRVYDAGDNGERLFEYLVAERPDINAWFVLEQGTPDWQRLRAAGATRLVAYGSFRWTMLMLNCRWLLSSHAGRPLTGPDGPIRAIRRPTWKYGFLQHGVIQSDLSRWFNRRDFDLFVVSTDGEWSSIVGDGTGYETTSKETRNTGLPRFDRLLAKANDVGADEANLVVLAPSWRKWLAFDVDEGTGRRSIAGAFWTSTFLQRWMEVVRSPEIEAAATRRGWRILFMPHPNFQPVLGDLELPGHVEARSFDGADVQDIYARCGLLVTDYSSVAFDVARLDRSIVYYQFDRDEFLGGGHIGRKGYFEYERDGFGPVVTGPDAAIRAIVASIEHGPRPTADYQDRIDRTFVDRDGRACARVVAAIEELSRPWAAAGPATGLH